MPIYNYQAFDTEGTLHKGSKDAASESEVRQFLRSRELFPKEIRTSRLYKANFGKGYDSGKIKFPKLPFRKWTSGKVITQFTRQLEVLLDASIPYDKAFQLIIPRFPEFSPERTILTYIAGKTSGCFPIATARGTPSTT